MPNYQSNQELPLTKTVQGTTATPSQIKLAPTEKGLPIGRPFAARFRVCDANGITIAVTNATAETVTLRVGPAEFESLAADHTEAAINVTHAAP